MFQKIKAKIGLWFLKGAVDDKYKLRRMVGRSQLNKVLKEGKVEAKKWYTSKTLWIAVIQGLAGVVAIVATDYPQLGSIAIAKSILDLLLRMVTDKPIS